MKVNVEKRESGITLVALVITVIILLILAGVALSMITGQNGLFARANQASFDYMDEAGVESDKVNGLQVYLEQYDIYGEGANNNNDDNNNVNDDPYYGGLADGKTIIQDIFLYETTQEPSGDTKGKAGVIGINWDYVIPGYSAGTEGAGSWTAGETYESMLRYLVVPYEVTLDNKLYEITSVQLGGQVKRGQTGTPLAYLTWVTTGATSEDGVYRDRI